MVANEEQLPLSWWHQLTVYHTSCTTLSPLFLKHKRIWRMNRSYEIMCFFITLTSVQVNFSGKTLSQKLRDWIDFKIMGANVFVESISQLIDDFSTVGRRLIRLCRPLYSARFTAPDTLGLQRQQRTRSRSISFVHRRHFCQRWGEGRLNYSRNWSSFVCLTLLNMVNSEVREKISSSSWRIYWQVVLNGHSIILKSFPIQFSRVNIAKENRSLNLMRG